MDKATADLIRAPETDKISVDLTSVIECAKEHGQMVAGLTIIDQVYRLSLDPTAYTDQNMAMRAIEQALRAAGWIA